MKLIRAALFGALLWAFIFFEVSVLMFGFGMNPGESTTYYIIHYALLILMSGIVAMLYFRGKVKRGFAEGLLVGLVMLVAGAILDLIITVPLFVKSFEFFYDVYLWIGSLIGVLTAGVVGFILAKSKSY